MENKDYLNPVTRGRMRSIYRMSDAQPDWAQTDPSQPDYIKNKEMAGQLRPIFINEEQIYEGSPNAEPVRIKNGDNVKIQVVDKTIIISAELEDNTETAASVAKALEEHIQSNIDSFKAVNEEIQQLKNNTGTGAIETILVNLVPQPIVNKTVSLTIPVALSDLQGYDIIEQVQESIKELQETIIEPQEIPKASTEEYGVVKLSDSIGIDQNGALSVKEVNIANVSLGENILILNGGNKTLINK